MDPGQSIKINPSLSSSIHVNMLHARELRAQEAGGEEVGLPPPTYRIHLGNKQSSCRTTCCASRAQTMADHVGQMSASHKINELNHVKNKAKAPLRHPKHCLRLQPARLSNSYASDPASRRLSTPETPPPASFITYSI